MWTEFASFQSGVCMCGMQVVDIQYVDNPEKFAENPYSYMETNIVWI